MTPRFTEIRYNTELPKYVELVSKLDLFYSTPAPLKSTTSTTKGAFVLSFKDYLESHLLVAFLKDYRDLWGVDLSAEVRSGVDSESLKYTRIDPSEVRYEVYISMAK